MTKPCRVLLASAVATACLACGLLFALPTGGSSGQSLETLIPTSIARTDSVVAFDTGTESNPTCSPARLGEAKQLVEQYLSNRISQLGILSTRISNSKSIPPADASSLETIITNERTGIADGGLSGLQSMVAGATTCLQVVSYAEAMVEDFRVYALVSPQVDLVAVASAENAISAQATTYEPRIQEAITTAGEHGKSVGGAQSAYPNLVTDVSKSETKVGDVPISTLLAQVPSDYPVDASTLVGYHEDLVAAAADLRSADEAFQAIVSDLTS
jgi:hypothetical protein